MTAPVLPGEPLRHADEVRSGPGTYVRGKSVMAAVMGHARTTPAADDADNKRPLVEVIKEPVVTGDATGRGGGTPGQAKEELYSCRSTRTGILTSS